MKVDINSWLTSFLKNVNETPNKIALRFQDTEISYKELNELSNWFARQISEKSRAEDAFVGICIDRKPVLIAAMIGAHKAGKAYIPLDSNFPSDRLSYIINDSGINLVVADRHGEQKLSETDTEIEFIPASDSDNLSEFYEYKHKKSDIAYVLYTSGSTGKPKGVVISHGAFINFLLSMQNEPGCTNSDVVLAITTISFDISGLEIFLPLISGAEIFLMEQKDIFDTASLLNRIKKNNVSIIQATPPYWKTLLDAGFRAHHGTKLLCGGDILSLELARRLFESKGQVWNMYGPTETTVWSSIWKIVESDISEVSIGKPIANTDLYILNEKGLPVKRGESGQLWISGSGLALGYLNKEELTEKVFKYHENYPGIRMYGTGDLVHENDNGEIIFEGRVDNQIKINGFRVESGEVENSILKIKGIKDVVVLTRVDHLDNMVLAAFYTSENNDLLDTSFIRSELRHFLPEYMIPSKFVKMETFPLTLNGKIDRKSFPSLSFKKKEDQAEIDDLRNIIRFEWENVLQKNDFTDDANFFDIGGYSLLIIQICDELSTKLNREILPNLFLQNPTVASMVEILAPEESTVPDIKRLNTEAENKNKNPADEEDDQDDFSLAIIGISCDFPGAETPEEFWRMLTEGRDGMSEYSREELLEEGHPVELIDHPDYIKRSGQMASAPYFDHEFFGYSPKEARFMDPQHRQMLQHSYWALESAGIDPFSYENKIGIFAGAGQNQYLLKNIMSSSEREQWSDFQTMISNSNDFLSSRVAYKLNLRGPAITVQTACSTSLVALGQAYQSLLNYQCDVALCGGVSINLPLKSGYLYTEGSILSKEGVCRSFDAEASGTMFGSGIGMVALKRLSEAKKDRDNIYAVVRSVALNNDGSNKIGYTAPSSSGQEDVIRDAMDLAAVSAEDVSYVETHGTGTILGDPIEISGLKGAFSGVSAKNKNCYLGSVKTNIGHLDAAAGIAGVIKTAFALKEGLIPATLNFLKPNPAMEIENSPFQVATENIEWNWVQRRIAGVSSFGVGGTNAHAILESWTDKKSTESVLSVSRFHIYPVSTKTGEVQENYLNELQGFLDGSPYTTRLNAAWTLQNRKLDFPYRGFIVSDKESGTFKQVFGRHSKFVNPQKVFLFPGQGSQYPGMCSGLYEQNAVFRENLDLSMGIIADKTGWNVPDLLFRNNELIHRTEYTQPLLFAVEWALGKTLEYYGVNADYMIGHSLGELVAVCLAGGCSLEDSIELVIIRGRLMSQAPEGRMLAVFSSFEEIKEIIPDDLDVAAINLNSQVVLSGTVDRVNLFIATLDDHNIPNKLLSSKSAFHSSLMEDILSDFADALSSVKFTALKRTVISNLTGKPLLPGTKVDSEYWIQHLRNTVLFQNGISELQDEKELIFIEVGPGAVLSRLVSSINTRKDKALVQTQQDSDSDGGLFFITALCNLWAAGCEINIEEINAIEKAQRIAVPRYPFAGYKHWISYRPKAHSMGVSEMTSSEEVGSPVDELKPKTVFQTVSSLWNNELGYKKSDPDTDFFSMGGDSIIAAQLSAKISNALSIHLHPGDILTCSSINKLSAKVDTLLSELGIAPETLREKEGATPVIESIPLDQDVPAPPAQRRLWFIHEYDPLNPAYNLALSIRMNMHVDRKLLSEALITVLRRHDIFRMTLKTVDAVPYLHDEGDVVSEFREYDLSGSIDPEKELHSMVLEASQKPIALDSFPHYRFGLYTLGSTRHYLVLYIHHAFIDGWSFNIFQRELELCYTALENKRTASLPVISRSYRDFAILDSNREKEDNSESVKFWKDYLDNTNHILELPYDYPRPAVMKSSGSMKKFSLSSEASLAFKDIAKEASASLFDVVSSAFSIALHKYSDQDDIVIGIPDANRAEGSLFDTMGFFLTMRPLRFQIDENGTFIDLVKQARRSMNNFQQYSDIGYDSIVESLSIPRNVNINPLFQVMMAFQNYNDVSVIGKLFRPETLNRGISEIDMTLYMWEMEGRIEGVVEYSTELFEPTTISTFLESYKEICDQLARESALELKKVSAAPKELQEKVFRELNDTIISRGTSVNFLQLFKEMSQKYADKKAACFEGKNLSYRELDEASSKIAGYLHSLSVGKGDLVGVYLHRGLYMLCSLLGVMKSGAAYVPLDPYFPDERINLIIEDAKIAHVISSPDISSFLEEQLENIHHISNILERTDVSESFFNSELIEAEDRAYILYTSGSTGIPNGVQIPHRALLNFLQSMACEPGIEASDKVLALTTMSFDISILELFLPLISGATIEIVSKETGLDTEKLAGIIDSSDISFAQATPSTWQMLLENGWTGKKGMKVLCGGEAVPFDLGKKLISQGMEFWNMYGPTETTIWSSLYRFTEESSEMYIGHPIDNTTLHILDRHLQPVPPGIAGELYIGGSGVSPGYLNRPELNAKRFIQNPFPEDPSPQLYKTGDRVLYAGNGNVKFLERVDAQVKLRGFRIELEEIESRARSHSDVINAVCIIKDFSQIDRRLVLFVRTENEDIVKELLVELQKTLPDYMIPSHIVIVEDFPHTPNGKVSRKELASYPILQTDTSSHSVLPANSDEEKAVELWKEVLNLPAVSLEDNFFTIGGHSLLAIKLLSKMNNTFMINLKLKDLFEYPTIRGLLKQSNRKKTNENIPIIFKVQSAEQGIPLFLVPGVYYEMYYQKGEDSAYEEDFLRYFNNIIVHFRMNTPIYGIRPRGIYFGEDFMPSVEEIAADNIRELKKVQPHGPYIIGGECIGGIVAYEMAQQLTAAGDRVKKLILMDTYKTNAKEEFKFKMSTQKKRFIDFFRQSARELKNKFKGESFSDFFSSYRKVFFPLSQKDRTFRRLFLGSKIYSYIIISYRPKPIDVNTLLVINSQWNQAYPTLGWDSHDFSRIDIRVVPGDHNTKLSTYGSETGAIIREAII